MQGELYIVATPIGNLEDITLRAINTLKKVSLIACEDTRHTLKLLNHLEIKKPLISYHRHNEEIKTDELINKLKQGENIALVSDAGTPVISDPGEQIVKVALNEGIKVIPIPGACALINALIASGQDSKEFAFFGFLPLDRKLRKQKLEEINEENKTIIFYEAPHKLRKTLQDLDEYIEDRNIVLAHELTKIHESFYKGTAKELLQELENPKGEFVVIVEGSKEDKAQEITEVLNNMSVEEHYKYYENQGMDKKEIIKKVAKDRGVSKNEVYQLFI